MRWMSDALRGAWTALAAHPGIFASVTLAVAALNVLAPLAILLFAIRPLHSGLAAAAKIDHSEKHRSSTRNTPQPRAFRGTNAKGFLSFIVSARLLSAMSALGSKAEPQTKGNTGL